MKKVKKATMTEPPQPTADRATSGRFQKGHSGNPAGRPAGSRNRASLIAQAMLEGECENLAKAAVRCALSGDAQALKLCFDRLLPARRDRRIQIELGNLETAEGISQAMTKVVEAVARGELTPTEGQNLTEMLDAKRTMIATESLERRVAALEEATGESSDEPKKRIFSSYP